MSEKSCDQRLSWIAICAVAFAALIATIPPAQAQRFLLDPTETNSFLVHSETNRFGACDFPFATVDRGALAASPFTDVRLTPQHALAGFNNFYRPGADPFPCNHADIRSWAGIVKFGLQSRRAEFANRRLTLAVLRITDAIAFREAGTINRTPPCTSGGGCIRSTNAMCRFQVGVMQQPLDVIDTANEELRFSSGRFAPGTLMSRPRQIQIAGTGLRRPILIDITREFRTWMTDGVEPGIVIFPDDGGVRSTDFATDCRVMFRFQLDVNVSD